MAETTDRLLRESNDADIRARGPTNDAGQPRLLTLTPTLTPTPTPGSSVLSWSNRAGDRRAAPRYSVTPR